MKKFRSGQKIRVGRRTVNTHVFFLAWQVLLHLPSPLLGFDGGDPWGWQPQGRSLMMLMIGLICGPELFPISMYSNTGFSTLKRTSMLILYMHRMMFTLTYILTRSVCETWMLPCSNKVHYGFFGIKVKVTRSLAFQRVLLVEYACQIWSLNLLWFKVMTEIWIFLPQTDTRDKK